MNIQYIKSLSEIEYKQTDIIFCYLTDKLEMNENILSSNLINYLISVSQSMSCLIFASFLQLQNEKEQRAVAIISSGELIDIYEENDIEKKFNLSIYDTRLGKVGILINSDIFNSNITYTFEAIGIDILLIFLDSNLKDEFERTPCNIPYIIIDEKEITTQKYE
ncbi:MAG: hypothetical protein ACI4TX_02605 [Christensenellales bacterium]